MENPVKHNLSLYLLLISVCTFFVHPDVIPVSIMEARNFITSREMLTENHWLLTTLNNVPRYQKPPLPSWIGSIFGAILGYNNIIAYRLPTAIMASLMVICWCKLSSRISENPQTGIMSALIFSTSFYTYIIQREAPTDIYTHGFMLAAIYQLFIFFRQDNNLYKHSLIAALFWGLSFLSKGPISLYALFLPFIISYGFIYRFREMKKRILPLIIFIVAGTVIGFWWFIYVKYADPHNLMAVAKRETDNWTSYNMRPFYYYWSFFTQTGIWTIPALLSLFYPYLKDRVSNKKAYTFSFIWTLAAVLLLSVIPEKKSRYLFPVLVPLALNTAFYIEYIVSRFHEFKKLAEKIPVYLTFGLIGLIALAVPAGLYIFVLKTAALPYLWAVLFSAGCLLSGILILTGLFRKQLNNSFTGTIAFIVVAICLGLPLAKTVYTDLPIKELRAEINDKHQNTYIFGEHSPELIWIYGKVIPPVTAGAEIERSLPASFKMLVTLSAFPDFQKKFEKGFMIKELNAVDLNYTSKKGRKGYKDRLVSKLFLLRKRDR